MADQQYPSPDEVRRKLGLEDSPRPVAPRQEARHTFMIVVEDKDAGIHVEPSQPDAVFEGRCVLCGHDVNAADCPCDNHGGCAGPHKNRRRA